MKGLCGRAGSCMERKRVRREARRSARGSRGQGGGVRSGAIVEKVLFRHRPGEQVALGYGATEFDQAYPLFVALHPFHHQEIPSACANATTLLMTAQLLGWVFIFWTKVLSSLIWLKGNSQSRSRDE